MKNHIFQDLESQLEKLSKRPDVQQSIREMEYDLAKGDRGIDPMTYRHNVLIKNLVDNARSIAWGQISNNPEVQNLISAEQQERDANYVRRNDPQQARGNYAKMQELLEMYR